MGKKTRKNLAALEKSAFATNTLDEFQEIIDEWLYAKANYKAYVKSVALMQEAPLNVVISGVNYSKVNRKAKQGDVIAFAQGVKNKIKKGEFYEAVESSFGTIFLNEEGDELKIYTGDGMIPVVYENVYKNKDEEEFEPVIADVNEPVESKRKFKVGDKVRVLNTENVLATTGLRVGDVAEVLRYNRVLGDGVVMLKSSYQTGCAYFEESALELAEEKTPNELRAEIIQRAKDVLSVWKRKNNVWYDNYRNSELPKPYNNWLMVAEFVVNEEKRTVVALLRGYETFDVATKGIAKCHPSDVFNEHIGKAIALGRALGKDVSEFENALQPTEPVVGHVVKGNEVLGPYSRDCKFTLTSKKDCDSFYYTENYRSDFIYSTQIGAIIDDTNAQYGGEKL